MTEEQQYIQWTAEYLCAFLYHNFNKLFDKSTSFNLDEIYLDLERINGYKEKMKNEK